MEEVVDEYEEELNVASLKLTFGKATTFGFEGPWGGVSRTPLILADMPDILSSLHWT